jgi:hypothetical protein
MERIAMSQQERDELDWLRRAKEGSISQREAAQKMGVSDRWVRKLVPGTERVSGRAAAAPRASHESSPCETPSVRHEPRVCERLRQPRRSRRASRESSPCEIPSDCRGGGAWARMPAKRGRHRGRRNALSDRWG